MGTTSKETLIQRISSTVGAGEEPINFSATGGSDTTSIVSTSANFRKTAATAYNGRVAVVTVASDAAPQGEARVVTTFNGTNDLTTGTFTAAVASGDRITLLPAGLDLTDVEEAINDVTRTLHIPRWLLLTRDPDGDMEATADWGAAVSGGTGDKETTAADTLLRRSQRVVGAGDGQGQRGAAFDVFEGELLYVDVALNCTTGTAQVELFDVGASAVISGTQYTTDELGFARINFSYPVEGNVQSVSVQITQDGATALDCNVGWVSVLSSRQAIYDLPGAAKDVSDIEAIEYLPEGTTIDNDATQLYERALRPWPMDKPIRDYFTSTTQKIQIALPRLEGPLFLRFSVTDTVLASTVLGMTSTVFLENDLLEAAVDGMISNAYKKLYAQQVKAGNDNMAAGYKREQIQHGKAYRALLDRLNLARPAPTSARQARVRAGVRW